jgi:deaminated glutathione amidase
MGVVEADLGLEPGVLTVEVWLETVERVRGSFPMFRQRRL